MFSSLNSNLEYYELYTYFYISLCSTLWMNSPYRWVFLNFTCYCWRIYFQSGILMYTYFYFSLCLTFWINSPYRWVFLTFPVIPEEFNSNLEYYVWILPIIFHTGEFFLSLPVIDEEFYSNLEYYVWDLQLFSNWIFLKTKHLIPNENYMFWNVEFYWFRSNKITIQYIFLQDFQQKYECWWYGKILRRR
jgi:hypothetical protein